MFINGDSNSINKNIYIAVNYQNNILSTIKMTPVDA